MSFFQIMLWAVISWNAFHFSAHAHTEKVVFIYNWQGYIPPAILKKFSQETGIKVVYDHFESTEAMESKLIIGSSGYDVVFPTSTVLKRLIDIGILTPLPYDKIPHAKDLDPQILKKLSSADPENKYAVPYLWGITGIGYNKDTFSLSEPVGWHVLFDPISVKKAAPRKITLLDNGIDVFQAALLYLGRDPCSHNPKDWDLAAKTVMAIRPYVTNFQEGSQQIASFTDGRTDLSLGYSTYIHIAQKRGRALVPPKEIQFVIPKEGAIIWFDLMAIPKDAPHLENALAFINFMLRPDVIAEITNTIGAANAVPPSYALVSPDLLASVSIFPPAEVMDKLKPEFLPPLWLMRYISRLWLKVKMGWKDF